MKGKISLPFTPDDYQAQRYAIFDGRANYDFDEAEILEYIGYEKSIEKALETTEHWKGVSAVLVDISREEHYEVVYDYTIDPS